MRARAVVAGFVVLVVAASACSTGESGPGAAPSSASDAGPVALPVQDAGRGGILPEAGTPGTIGSAGGTVRAGAVVLDVPPGALDASVAITIEDDGPATVPNVRVEGHVYRFQPAGLAFAKPVTVSFPFTGTAPAVYWTGETSSAFAALPTTIEAGRAVAHPTHFSRGFVGEDEPLAETDAPEAPASAPEGTDSVGRCAAIGVVAGGLSGLLGMVVTLISDLTYTWVDPRIDFESREV